MLFSFSAVEISGLCEHLYFAQLPAKVRKELIKANKMLPPTVMFAEVSVRASDNATYGFDQGCLQTSQAPPVH